MSIKEKLQLKIESMSQADLERLQQMLEQRRRDNLKRLIWELADSAD